jgi:predicted Zn-dependent peptidase
MKAECQFIANSGDYFAEFTEKLHHDGPLIHLLFAELRELILVLSRRILKEKNAETMAKRLDAKLFDDLSNMKSLANIVLSYVYLKNVEEGNKNFFLMKVC